MARAGAQSTERLILGITGPIGSGKTSVGKYLETEHRFGYIRYSQVLAEWMNTDPQRKGQLQTVGWEVMAGGMQEELNRRLIARIPNAQDVVVDGLRHPIDFNSLQNAFGSSFHLLYLDAPLKIRWQRERGNPRFSSFDQFKAANEHPVEQQITSLRDRAFAVLDTSGSLELVKSQVEKLVSELRMGIRR
jgi:dephospho-CoA kinase